MNRPPSRNTGPSPPSVGPPARSPAPSTAPSLPAPPARPEAAADLAGSLSNEELRVEYERLRAALTEDPGSSGHWLLLADVCLRLGRKEEAKALLVKAIERDPRTRASALALLKGRVSESELARMPLDDERVPFYQDATDILMFPLRGNGPALLVGGGIVFTGLAFLAQISSIFFWIPALITIGYLASFLMTVIDSSGRGQREPPDYPDFLDIWDSVLGPFWIALSACAIPAALPLAYFFLRGADIGLIPCVAIGLLYLPMSLTAGAVLQRALPPLNLPLVVKAIRTAGKEYFIAVAVVYGLALASWLMNALMIDLLPLVIARPVAQTIDLYFLLAEMYILGRVYRNHETEIGWYRRGQVPLEPASAPPSPAAPAPAKGKRGT